MVKYRGAVIGLGWMGMLYDLAQRMGVWHVDDIDRPTPELDIHRKFYSTFAEKVDAEQLRGGTVR